MQIDALDELRESIRNSAAYPENLICSPYSQRNLSGYLCALDSLNGVDTNQQAPSWLFGETGPKNNVEFLDVFDAHQGTTTPSFQHFFSYGFLQVSKSE